MSLKYFCLLFLSRKDVWLVNMGTRDALELSFRVNYKADILDVYLCVLEWRFLLFARWIFSQDTCILVVLISTENNICSLLPILIECGVITDLINFPAFPTIFLTFIQEFYICISIIDIFSPIFRV